MGGPSPICKAVKILVRFHEAIYWILTMKCKEKIRNYTHILIKSTGFHIKFTLCDGAKRFESNRIDDIPHLDPVRTGHAACLVK